MRIFISLIKALVLTIIIEGTVVYIITKDTKMLRYSIYCNLMTNPLLNLIGILFALISHNAFIIWTAVGETAVLISEAALYRLFGDVSKKKAIILSAAANLCSFISGLLLSRYGII
ncbi:MAG: hypothetical protein ILP19_02210 [Oscillospiraceae bacterium]|nr:hypothetical protein [Oscillospiraceae bacterium]